MKKEIYRKLKLKFQLLIYAKIHLFENLLYLFYKFPIKKLTIKKLSEHVKETKLLIQTKFQNKMKLIYIKNFL